MKRHCFPSAEKTEKRKVRPVVIEMDQRTNLFQNLNELEFQSIDVLFARSKVFQRGKELVR